MHPVLAFARESPTETVLVAVNLSGLFVSDGPYDLPGVPAEALYGDGHPGPPSGTSGAWRVSLPPYATLVLRFE